MVQNGQCRSTNCAAEAGLVRIHSVPGGTLWLPTANLPIWRNPWRRAPDLAVNRVELRGSIWAAGEHHKFSEARLLAANCPLTCASVNPRTPASARQHRQGRVA
jgi:hypothetical protein